MHLAIGKNSVWTLLKITLIELDPWDLFNQNGLQDKRLGSGLLVQVICHL